MPHLVHGRLKKTKNNFLKTIVMQNCFLSETRNLWFRAFKQLNPPPAPPKTNSVRATALHVRTWTKRNQIRSISLYNKTFLCSLNVSNLNSLATVTFEDFIRPIPYMKDLKDQQQLQVIKGIGVVYGFVIMGISFGVGLLSGVIESSMLVTSATSGPLLGVFILAILVPCCNWKVSTLV